MRCRKTTTVIDEEYATNNLKRKNGSRWVARRPIQGGAKVNRKRLAASSRRSGRKAEAEYYSN